MHQPSIKKIVSLAGILAIITLVLGYGVWISRDILFGIHFSVSGLHDGLSTSEPLLTVSGNAYHASMLVIDGRTVPLSDTGSWQDTLALLPGYNTIQISVTDRFKRTTTKEYRVYYKTEQSNQ